MAAISFAGRGGTAGRRCYANLRSLDKRPRPYMTQGISYLPRLKRCRLVIVGAGHVGQKVGELAAECGF